MLVILVPSSLPLVTYAHRTWHWHW